MVGNIARDDESALLHDLREASRKQRALDAQPPQSQITAGALIADIVAATMGSWRFIIIQSTILLAWIALNIMAWIQHWDPYPFIMMSQNRQQDIDRKEGAADYQINIKAELEIELLHQKLDELREKEGLSLTDAVRSLTKLLEEREHVVRRKR